MVIRDKDRVTPEGVLGAWLGLIIVTIVMVTLTFTIFDNRWQWWMWFPIMGTSIGVLVTMTYYFGRDSKKCPKCGKRMNFGIEYCKQCGTHVPSMCNSCGAPITGSSQFCEKCGKQLLASNFAQQPITSKTVSQNPVQSSNAGRFCPGCGGKVKLEAQYCSSCGFTL